MRVRGAAQTCTGVSVAAAVVHCVRVCRAGQKYIYSRVVSVYVCMSHNSKVCVIIYVLKNAVCVRGFGQPNSGALSVPWWP